VGESRNEARRTIARSGEVSTRKPSGVAHTEGSRDQEKTSEATAGASALIHAILSVSNGMNEEAIRPLGVPCGERQRLEKIYLDAVVDNARAGLHISDIRSEAWRDATKETREMCEAALAELNAHRREHGC
jgi:hypothetical protein